MAVIAQKSYVARARRSGRWWAIDVPEVPGAFSQARRLDQVDAMAREAIALVLDLSPDEIDVVVQPQIPDASIEALLRDVRYHRNVAEEASRLAASGSIEAARRLTEHGYGVRDVGSLLGVSFQRAAQLTSAPETARSVREVRASYDAGTRRPHLILRKSPR